jgi:hypothetical protein
MPARAAGKRVLADPRQRYRGRVSLAAHIMLDLLLAHKIAVGRLLSVVGATATVVIFEYFFELAWFISVPAAVLAYVTMPMLWAELLRSVPLQSGRRGDPPPGS